MSLLEAFLKAANIDESETAQEYFEPPARKSRVRKTKEDYESEPEIKKPSIEELNETDIRDLTVEEFEEISGLPKKLMNLTVYQLVNKYGGVMSLNKWADFLSKLVTIAEKEQKIQMRKNELIEKDFVTSGLLKFVDLFVNQIMDLAESDVEEIIAMVKTDEETARKLIPDHRRKSYTKIAKECKKSMGDSLKRLKQKYDTDEE